MTKDTAEIICAVLNNETILIGELINGDMDSTSLTIREAGAIIATQPEGSSEDEEPEMFYIRDFLGELVDEGRCFTINTDSIMMVFYPPEMAIDAYESWIKSSEGIEIEFSEETESSSDPEDNVVHFNPSDEI